MKFGWGQYVALKRNTPLMPMHRRHAGVSFGDDTVEEKTDLRRNRGQRPGRTPVDARQRVEDDEHSGNPSSSRTDNV